ncbi:MAG TPA: hypothetical protein DGH68_11575 [Bacteroidetes bacterium]|nr:hypothetical protein [Bacteroidota bacterium]
MVTLRVNRLSSGDDKWWVVSWKRPQKPLFWGQEHKNNTFGQRIEWSLETWVYCVTRLCSEGWWTMAAPNSFPKISKATDMKESLGKPPEDAGQKFHDDRAIESTRLLPE